uniref:Uncharacterized protein n=1 Tax=Daphnia galeata TaxID=27404 RepID=A0A8J2W337_9CRUS|nr:unnamed protein product [Daphnia galeata]
MTWRADEVDKLVTSQLIFGNELRTAQDSLDGYAMLCNNSFAGSFHTVSIANLHKWRQLFDQTERKMNRIKGLLPACSRLLTLPSTGPGYNLCLVGKKNTGTRSEMVPFDPEGFGEIPWEDFGRALRSPEFRQHIEPHKIQQLEEKFHLQQQLDKEQEDNKSGCSGGGGGGHHDDDRPSRTSAITFQDFVNVDLYFYDVYFEFSLLLFFGGRDVLDRRWVAPPDDPFWVLPIEWNADPSVQLSAGHDQSRSQQLRFPEANSVLNFSAPTRQERKDGVDQVHFVGVAGDLYTMSGKRSRSFKCAVHHRDRQVCSENDFHLLLQPPTFFQRAPQ